MTDVQDTPVAQKYKVCKKCGELKLTTEFSKHPSTKDRLNYKCKHCAVLCAAEWRIVNRDKYVKYMNDTREKNIVKCAIYRKEHIDKIKELRANWRKINPEYSATNSALWREKNPSKSAEYYVNNKDKCNQATRKWQKENPEKVRAILASRRARKKNAEGKHSSYDILHLLSLQKQKCACCNKSIKSGYHVDHIQPISKGGTNGKDNIQLLCPTCNRTKSASDPIDFMQSRGFLL